jgi:galactonate dehydratase
MRGIKPLKVTGCRIYIVAIGGRNPILVQLLTDQGVTGVGDAAVAYGTGAASAAALDFGLLVLSSMHRARRI